MWGDGWWSACICERGAWLALLGGCVHGSLFAVSWSPPWPSLSHAVSDTLQASFSRELGIPQIPESVTH